VTTTTRRQELKEKAVETPTSSSSKRTNFHASIRNILCGREMGTRAAREASEIATCRRPVVQLFELTNKRAAREAHTKEKNLKNVCTAK
jgi:hypothetical protein